MLTLTFQRPNQPAYEITVPEAAVAAADRYASEIGLANTEHLMMRLMLDNLLVNTILPRVEHPPEVQAELQRITAEQAAIRAEYETKRLSPYLPELRIGGRVTTLPEIEAQLQAAREK
jgi:hypothetical protein